MVRALQLSFLLLLLSGTVRAASFMGSRSALQDLVLCREIQCLHTTTAYQGLLKRLTFTTVYPALSVQAFYAVDRTLVGLTFLGPAHLARSAMQRLLQTEWHRGALMSPPSVARLCLQPAGQAVQAREAAGMITDVYLGDQLTARCTEEYGTAIFSLWVH